MVEKLRRRMRDWPQLWLDGGASLVRSPGVQFDGKGSLLVRRMLAIGFQSCGNDERREERREEREGRKKKKVCRGGGESR